MSASLKEMDLISRRIRRWLVEITNKKRTAHLASALSCVDILVAAYWGGTLQVDPHQPKGSQSGSNHPQQRSCSRGIIRGFGLQGFFSGGSCWTHGMRMAEICLSTLHLIVYLVWN